MFCWSQHLFPSPWLSSGLLHFFSNYFHNGSVLFVILLTQHIWFLSAFLSTARTEACPKSVGHITRRPCDNCLKFKMSLCVVCPSLCAEGNGEISFLYPGMPSSGGHTVSVVAACGWWAEFSHSTPKEVFVSAAPKLPPWNQCLLKTVLWEKKRRKESFWKAERRGEI